MSPVIDSRTVRTARACILRIIKRAIEENDVSSLEKDIKRIMDALLQEEKWCGN